MWRDSTLMRVLLTFFLTIHSVVVSPATPTHHPATLEVGEEKPTDFPGADPPGMIFASSSTFPLALSPLHEDLKPHPTLKSPSDSSKPFPPSTSAARPRLPREASSSTQHYLSRDGSPAASTSTSKSRSEGSTTPMVDDVVKVLKKKRVKKEKEVLVAQLIGHLPRAEEEVSRSSSSFWYGF